MVKWGRTNKNNIPSAHRKLCLEKQSCCSAKGRRQRRRRRSSSSRRMAAVGNNINSYACLSSVLTCPSQNKNEVLFLLMMGKKATCCGISSISISSSSRCFISSKINSFRRSGIKCELRESGNGCGVEKHPITGDVSLSSRNRMEEYNTAMKRMMRNPYEYHHDLGMNYTLITDNLIVGSQPQKREDVDHLKHGENVAYILNLQQDNDVEYWGIDLQSIIQRCQQLGIRHMRRPAKDFDPDSLRIMLPKAVSSLEWAISEGKGRVYVHCTAGLGRAPAVAIAYMFWFGSMNLNTAYDTLTSKRPCGPNKRSIRGATYDLAKNDPWKEPFESLPEYAFEDVADWERNLIQGRVRSLRGT